MKYILHVIDFVLILIMTICAYGGGCIFYVIICALLRFDNINDNGFIISIFAGMFLSWLILRPIYLKYFDLGDGELYERRRTSNDK